MELFNLEITRREKIFTEKENQLAKWEQEMAEKVKECRKIEGLVFRVRNFELQMIRGRHSRFKSQRSRPNPNFGIGIGFKTFGIGDRERIISGLGSRMPISAKDELHFLILIIFSTQFSKHKKS